MGEILHLDKIKPELLQQWRATYDEFSLSDELANASQWIQDNGKSYKNYGRFYGNWLRRSAVKKKIFNKETEEHFFSKDEKEWPELFKLLGLSESDV